MAQELVEEYQDGILINSYYIEVPDITPEQILAEKEAKLLEIYNEIQALKDANNLN